VSLHAKMADAQQAIGSMKPDGHANITTKSGGSYSYDYLTEGALMAAVKKELAAQGVAIYVSCEKQWEEAGATRTELLVTFADAESNETFSVKGQGAGTDMGDKGVYKAQTGALRYVLWKTFLIPSGDEPDADHTERKDHKSAEGAKPDSDAPSAEPTTFENPTEKAEKAAKIKDFDGLLARLNELDEHTDWVRLAKDYVAKSWKKQSRKQLTLEQLRLLTEEFESRRLLLEVNQAYVDAHTSDAVTK
jgi:hypothetical protein